MTAKLTEPMIRAVANVLYEQERDDRPGSLAGARPEVIENYEARAIEVVLIVVEHVNRWQRAS